MQHRAVTRNAPQGSLAWLPAPAPRSQQGEHRGEKQGGPLNRVGKSRKSTGGKQGKQRGKARAHPFTDLEKAGQLVSWQSWSNGQYQPAAISQCSRGRRGRTWGGGIEPDLKKLNTIANFNPQTNTLAKVDFKMPYIV